MKRILLVVGIGIGGCVFFAITAAQAPGLDATAAPVPVQSYSITDLLGWAVPFVILYNVWLHNQVISLKTDLAVNSTKDEALNEKIDKAITGLDRAIEEIGSLKSLIIKELIESKKND